MIRWPRMNCCRLVYAELPPLAARYLQEERVGHMLQSTVLVHEAFMRPVKEINGKFSTDGNRKRSY